MDHREWNARFGKGPIPLRLGHKVADWGDDHHLQQGDCQGVVKVIDCEQRLHAHTCKQSSTRASQSRPNSLTCLQCSQCKFKVLKSETARVCIYLGNITIANIVPNRYKPPIELVLATRSYNASIGVSMTHPRPCLRTGLGEYGQRLLRQKVCHYICPCNSEHIVRSHLVCKMYSHGSNAVVGCCSKFQPS